MSKLDRRKGFTLVELLVAMLIFSLLSSFAYLSIGTLGRVSEALWKEDEGLRQLQHGLFFLTKDLKAASDIVIVIVEGDGNNKEGTVSSQGVSLSVFADGAGADSGQLYANQQQVKHTYLVLGSVLYRSTHAVNSNVSANTELENSGDSLPLIQNVISFSVRSVPCNDDQIDSLSGIRMVFQHGELGMIERFIHIADCFKADKIFSTNTLDTLIVPTTVGGVKALTSTDSTVAVDEFDW